MRGTGLWCVNCVAVLSETRQTYHAEGEVNWWREEDDRYLDRMTLNLDSWSRLDSSEVRRVLATPLATLPSGQPALSTVVSDFTLVSFAYCVCIEMGRQVWTALLVVALTTASSLQFTVIDHVPTPNDISQKSPATWRPSGEYRRSECLTCYFNFKI